MRIVKYISIFVLLIAGILYLLRRQEPYAAMNGQTMGTYYNIKVRADNDDKLLHKSIKDELQKINEQMSVFDANSEISRINKAEANTWIDLSPEMSLVLKSAYQNYRKSGGTFDPTIGKLIDLWGFGASGMQKYPDETEIKDVLADSGFDKIVFSEDFRRLKKKNANVILNLSAIAKGYGVDRIAALLKEKGYRNFVVEIGGEVYAAGQKSAEAKGWKVGIIRPVGNYTENAHIALLRDMAVATSGDYRNFIYIDDKKFSHTISPQTGYPVQSRLISATVFNQSCMEADALTTAMMAMGETKALEFANRQGLAAILFVRNDDDSVSELRSKAAAKILGL